MSNINIPNSKKYDISEEEEMSLWHQYSNNQDLKIRDYFIEKYTPLVQKIAGRISGGIPQNYIPYEDLVGYGCIGLIDAIKRYDPERKNKFQTYANSRIYGSIIDELRKKEWKPRTVIQKQKNIQNAIEELENQLGRSAKNEEIAEYLGIPTEQLNKELSDISNSNVVSLFDSLYENITFMEAATSPIKFNPDNIAEMQEIKKTIMNSINNILPEEEKKVIALYYYDELTLREIGHLLNKTESRISQLHAKAIMRLKVELSKHKINL